MLTDVPGVSVGHWTNELARTGCTVVLFPPGTVASGEVRGGAPGTREFALLEPGRTVSTVDAVLLAGGSAFGLAAADGVVTWLAEHGRGYVTPSGTVPIVVGCVLYDLAVGDGNVRPDAFAGRAACDAASVGLSAGHAVGAVGAGTGATVGKWRGREAATPGGIGSATVRHGDLIVSALMAVNAFGDIVGDGGLPLDALSEFGGPTFGENTTIGVVVTNAALDKVGCHLVAQSAHDGLARALWPVHSTSDGDAVVAASIRDDGPALVAPIDLVRMLTVAAVANAVRASVGGSG